MVRMLQVSTLALALSAVACKKSAPEPAMLSAAPTSPVQAAVPAHVADVQRLMENFRRVSFDLDSSTLNAQTKRVLDENAGILQRRTDVKIEVQGHCDERGTTDYNLALGQRRAEAVLKYLTARGVP
ncbi:MAG: OmpA family protein, partial [Myxococcales bacterium]|nr:OmpA family protein [Myxococcales bacterium]